jgi:hypothetical protein
MANVAVVGVSGLKEVEYWFHMERGTHGVLDSTPQWSMSSASRSRQAACRL